jgi:ankyrin repeat protein
LIKEADLNAKDKYGNSALHVCVCNGSVDMVKFLVKEKGMDVNAKGVGGLTTLDLAVGIPSSEEVIDFLASKGAERSNAKIIEGTIRKFALKERDTGILKFLKDNGLLEGSYFSNYGGGMLLHILVKADVRDKAFLELVIGECKGVLDKKDANNKTALLVAVEKNNKDMTELLIAHGANVNVQNDDGDTALHLAVDNNYLDLVRLLVNVNGIDFDVRNNDGDIVLHSAVEGDDIVTIELLLTKGANVKVEGKNGNTALHLASAKGKIDVVEVLLAHGADVNAKNDGGLTPLDRAKGDDIKDVLTKAGGESGKVKK